jgi:glycosyltransferase involved in cell wall biosynthesis
VLHQENPLISVITVVLNDRKGLAVTANSLVPILGTNLEWIILDGNSTDGTWDESLKLASEYGVKIMQSEPRGIYPAMNNASRLASGKYLWFINAGDFILDSKIAAALLELIRKDQDVHLYANPVAILTKSGYLYDLYYPRVLRSLDSVVAAFHHQGCLISNHVFQKIGGYDESLTLAADGKLLDTIVSSGSYKIHNLATVGFRMGGASSMNYAETISEIFSYRPDQIMKLENSYFRYKTSIRLCLIDLEESRFFQKIVKSYFAFRQYRVLKSNNTSNLPRKDFVRFNLSPHKFTIVVDSDKLID